MLSIYVFLLLNAIVAHVAQGNPTGDTVLMLTRENFTDALAENEFLLVNFYAPWCGHCKALAPEYTKAAEELSRNKLRVKFAKVDATIDDELAYEQHVRGYPTIKFFRNGSSSILYSGGRLAEDIVSWIKKELEPPTQELSNIEAVEKFLGENKIAVIGFFKNPETERAQIFSTLAKELKNFAFGLTNNEELFAKYNAEDEFIILFKPFDEQRSVYEGSNNLDDLKKFIQLESLPLIMEFEHESASKTLHGPTKSFLLFFITGREQLEDSIEMLQGLAKQYRKTVLFVTITYDDHDKKRAFEYFGISKEETPTLRLITLNERNDLVKYKPDTEEISKRIVDEFIQQYAEGCLKPHYLSQALPDDWDARPLKVLVASNFNDVVFDNEKIVLVEFYAPWCGHCQQVETVLQQLAEKYRDNPNIVIAKINGVANEIENMKVTIFPTIKLFRKEYAEVIDYERARTFDELNQFIKEELRRINVYVKDEL